MNLFVDCQLYAFVDTAYLAGRSAATVAAQLCDGGATVVQLRAKSADQDAILRLAETIKPITDRTRTLFVINDYPAVAAQIGADAVHLGQEDFFTAGLTRAEEVTGSPRRFGLGLSTHSPVQAERAVQAGPDYLAVGPVFATATKPGRLPVTLEYVRWASQHLQIPWFAIGGITLENLDQVLEAGARRICVVSAILNAPDVAKACQEFSQRIASAR